MTWELDRENLTSWLEDVRNLAKHLKRTNFEYTDGTAMSKFFSQLTG